jgi:hypothetical protein
MGHRGTFARNDWQACSVQGIYILLTYAEFFLTSRHTVWKSNDASGSYRDRRQSTTLEVLHLAYIGDA